MAFKLLYENTAAPQGDFLVDPNLVAEAGMLGVVSGTTTGSPTGLPMVVLGFSGVTGLVGIIDENKTTQFIAAVIGEAVVSGQTTLAHANLVATTFAVSTGLGTTTPQTNAATLSSATNGTITGISGTAAVNYSYVIPGKAGDDTTLASGKCTIWLQEGEYATDVYELTSTVTVSSYTVGAALYVSNTTGQIGRLTTASGAGSYDSGLVVGYVTKAPTAGNPVMNFYKKNI